MNLKLSKGVLDYLDKKTGEKSNLKDFNLSIKDLSLGKTPGDIIRNASFTGRVDCKELLQKDLRIENLSAAVKVARGDTISSLLPSGRLNLDRKSGEKIELKEINLSIKDLSVVDTSGDIIKNISFTGNLDCKEVQKKNLKISNFKSFVQGGEGGIPSQTLYHGYLRLNG